LLSNYLAKQKMCAERERKRGKERERECDKLKSG
jgi:hypothetical protein